MWMGAKIAVDELPSSYLPKLLVTYEICGDNLFISGS